jgi:hypothetical protein
MIARVEEPGRTNLKNFYKRVILCKRCGKPYGSDQDIKFDNGYCRVCVPHGLRKCAK